MVADFLIVFKVANLARRSRADTRAPLATCRALASGTDVPARALFDAQLFALRWWSNLAGALFVPVLMLAVIDAIVRPGKFGRLVVAGVMVVLFTLVMCAVAQIFVQRIRLFATRRWVYRMGLNADVLPLPRGSRGLPRSRDFWLASAIAIVLFGLAAYAGLTAPGGT